LELFLAGIFYFVAILGLCVFAIYEALALLRKPKKNEETKNKSSEPQTIQPIGKARLDTDNLKVRPLNQEEASLMAHIFFSLLDDEKDWEFDADNGFITVKNGEKIEIPWICRVIRKRIVGENLRIKITQQAYFILMVFTEGNPGRAMFSLHKIGNFFEKQNSQNWLLNSKTLAADLFPFGIPTEEAFGDWWDRQKATPGANKSWSDNMNMVDMFPDEWRKESTAK